MERTREESSDADVIKSYSHTCKPISKFRNLSLHMKSSGCFSHGGKNGTVHFSQFLLSLYTLKNLSESGTVVFKGFSSPNAHLSLAITMCWPRAHVIAIGLALIAVRESAGEIKPDDLLIYLQHISKLNHCHASKWTFSKRVAELSVLLSSDFSIGSPRIRAVLFPYQC